MSDKRRIEEAASAIEDLLYMGAMRLEGEKALLSPQFSLVATNVKEGMKLRTTESNDVMKLMYYSFLIYLTEHLKIPRAFAMALGNDMEKNRESMETGELVTTYVSILSQIWSRGMKGA